MNRVVAVPTPSNTNQAQADRLIADIASVFGPIYDEFPFRSFVASLPPEPPAGSEIVGFDMTGLNSLYTNDPANDLRWDAALNRSEAIVTAGSACAPKTCYAKCQNNDVLLRKLCKLISDDVVKKMKKFGCKGSYCNTPSFAKSCAKKKASSCAITPVIRRVVSIKKGCSTGTCTR